MIHFEMIHLVGGGAMGKETKSDWPTVDKGGAEVDIHG